jgi:hypothetical protein
MEIENALYESKYVEGVWNTINNIAQNGVEAGIKKSIQDFTQKKADIENKIAPDVNQAAADKNQAAADKKIKKASKNFMTDKEWQTFINNVGSLIQNNKKNMSSNKESK